MSRRNVTYVALVVASFVLSACSQPTAPVRDDTLNCPNGVVVMGSGILGCAE